MNVLDATGRELKKDQLVELMLTGMFRAVVKEVREKTLSIDAVPPTVIVQVTLQIPVNVLDGKVANTYIIADPPPEPSKLVS